MLKANVNNETISDEQFRILVKSILEVVEEN
jgi:hypothetical protein